MIGKILAVASTLLVLVADSGNKQWLFLIFFLLFLGFDLATADGGKGDWRTDGRKIQILLCVGVGPILGRDILDAFLPPTLLPGFSGLHFGRHGAIT